MTREFQSDELQTALATFARDAELHTCSERQVEDDGSFETSDCSVAVLLDEATIDGKATRAAKPGA